MRDLQVNVTHKHRPLSLFRGILLDDPNEKLLTNSPDPPSVRYGKDRGSRDVCFRHLGFGVWGLGFRNLVSEVSGSCRG